MRALSDADSASLRAGFLAAARRPVEARAEIAAARSHQATAGSFEVEGLLFDSERKTPQALAAYARAIELGSTNFYAYYRDVQLTPMTDQTTRVHNEQMLTRAAALAPRYSGIYSILADVNLALGRGSEAVKNARRAVELDPGRSSYRVVLARILWGLAQQADALREAREALALAHSDVDRRNAQRLVELYSVP
jgi:tetratricopeptide (TPR) repeat protein